MSSHNFTICVSLLRSVAWRSCKSIETAESQGKEPDVRARCAHRGCAAEEILRGARCRVRPGREERQALPASHGRVDSLRIVFISRRENIDTSGPMGQLFLTLIGSIAELESNLIRERVLAGMRRAKLDGVRIGCAPMNIDRAAIVRDRLSGMTLTAVSKKWGVSRSLVCKLVNRASAGDEGSVPPQTQVADLAVVQQSSPAEARW
jgi:hypothetical protein